MHKVTACKAEDDYKLWLRFEDGLEGSVFLGNLLEIGAFKLWRDVREFEKVSVDPESATVTWEGGIRLDSFDEAHLMNADTRALMQKITFVENPEFTKTYPHDHRTRIVVTLADGRQVTGESGGGDDDLSSPKTQAQIGEKFLSLTGDFLGRERATGLLERLWDLDKMADVADIPPALAA